MSFRLLLNKTAFVSEKNCLMACNITVHFLCWTRPDWPGLIFFWWWDHRPTYLPRPIASFCRRLVLRRFVCSSCVACLVLGRTLCFRCMLAVTIFGRHRNGFVYVDLPIHIWGCHGRFSLLAQEWIWDLILTTRWWWRCWYSDMRRRKVLFRTVFGRLGVSDTVWVVNLIDQLFENLRGM